MKINVVSATLAQTLDDDSFRIPLGDWASQLIDWSDNHLKGVFEAIAWPFDFLFDLITITDGGSVTFPRVAVIVVLGLVAYLGGGLQRTVYVTGSIGLLALMGDTIWGLAMWSMSGLLVVLVVVAFLTFAATALLSIGAFREHVGRSRAVNRVLNGWSWIHPYGLLVPTIFFFGIGTTSALILTTFLVLPVAIAAAFSRPETTSRRPLLDLSDRTRLGARAAVPPAQLLLAIFALSGMGGLGSRLFGALSVQDPASASDSAIAIWLLTVALWSLLGPWSFDHLPGIAARRQRRAETSAAKQAVDQAVPAENSIPAGV